MSRPPEGNVFPIIPADKMSFSRRRPVYGFGINDAKYKTQIIINGVKIICPYYLTWVSMIKRCYCKKTQLRQPTYRGCTVSKEWLLFSKFKAWMEKQEWNGKALDKDIINPGNTIYSEEKCLFVTGRINSLLNNHSRKRGKFPQGVNLYKKTNKYRAALSSNGIKNILDILILLSRPAKSTKKLKESI